MKLKTIFKPQRRSMWSCGPDELLSGLNFISDWHYLWFFYNHRCEWWLRVSYYHSKWSKSLGIIESFDDFQLQSCVRSLPDFKNDFYFGVIRGLLNRRNCANFSRNKALECRSEWARVCYTPNCKSMGHFADVLVVDNG